MQLARRYFALLVLCLACSISVVSADDCTCQCDCTQGAEQSKLKGVDVLFGFGQSIRLDDYIDWKETVIDKKRYLLIENDSRGRATGMLGLGVNFIENCDKWQLFASMNFLDNTSPVIDGFVFGINRKLNDHVGIAGGYGLHKQIELRHGFKRDAEQYVRKHKMEEWYSILGAADPRSYDGFPLDGDGNLPRLAASPIADSFNKSVFIGLTFTVPVLNLLRK